jgi:hypothetical protein
MKRCRGCNNDKEETDYYHTSFGGRDTVCKRCRIEGVRRQTVVRFFKRKNPQLCVTCGMELLPYLKDGETIVPRWFCDDACKSYPHLLNTVDKSLI